MEIVDGIEYIDSLFSAKKRLDNGHIPSENSGKCRENMMAAPSLFSAALL